MKRSLITNAEKPRPALTKAGALRFALIRALMVVVFGLVGHSLSSQTTINFDDDTKWTAGSALLGSYANNHSYVDGVFSATGGEALRNSNLAQDGYPGALGTYSWRLRDKNTVDWKITIASGGVSTFSIDLRRWDASPSPAFDLDYSINGGITWVNVAVINNTTLGNTSNWVTFSGSINSANNNIIIRLKATGTTERIMVDNFVWTPYSVSPTLTATPTSLSGFTYVEGSGPSTSQSYDLSGSNLTGFPGNITVTAPTNYQISTDGSTWYSTLNVPYTSATLSTTTIYVRLKSGLTAGTYNGEIITNTGGGVSSPVNVTCDGTVTSTSSNCGTENFENIPTTSSTSYSSRTWIGTDGVTWTAEGARTDQTLNGKAICFGTSGTRYVQSPTYSNGIGQLTFKYVRGFTGSGARTIQVLVNNVQIGSDISVSPTSDVVQTYSQAINIAGDVVVEITSTGAGQVIIDDISWTCFNVTGPTLIASPELLSGFHYIYGSGPSSVQSFSLSGVLLSGAPGNISLTAPANYEISLDNLSFLSDLLIPYSSATLPATTVYVRLKAGLSIGAYNNEMINISGGGSMGASVECKGYVSSSSTQAIAPGDLAILAFNTDIGTGEDEISFVCFVPISVGAIIDITDNAYEKCGTPNGWGISEGWIRFERKNYPLPEGEIVTVRVLNGNPSIVSPDPTNWTASKPQPINQGNFNMNEYGEQIFFLSGGNVGGPNENTATTDAGTYSGYFLYGFNTKGNIWTPICGNAAAGGTQNSAKPKNFDCFLVWPTSQADRNKYTGPLTPTSQRDWIDRIGDTLNWTGYVDNPAYNAGPDYINFNGPNLGRTISITPGGFSHGKWVGTTSIDWFECSNWESMRVPDSYTNVVIPTNGVTYEPSIGAPPTGVNSAYCNDITIFPNHTLTIDNSQSKLEVYGNFVNNSFLSHTNGTIYLKGGLNTTFTGTNDITVYNLDLSKPTANLVVTLGKNLNISNKLTFTNGIITTGTNRVTVTNTAPAAISGHVIPGSSAFTGYINGNLRRHVAATGSYDFPVGTATQYEYSNINLTASSGLNYINAFFTTPHTTPIDITPLNLMMGPTHINELLDYGFWTITPSGGTYTYDVTLTERGHTNPGATAESHTVVKRPNASSNWVLQGTHNNSTQSMGSTPVNWVTAKRTSLNIFSDFAIAKSNIGALPVELISFDAYLSNGAGVIDWSTASETNCSHFVIERSANDMMYFEPIATVAGSGNSNMRNNYSIKDYDVQPGINYYRLVQYDYDGSRNEIGVEYIVLSAANEPISIASISNTGNGVLADIINIQGGYFEVQVLDVTGKLVYSAFSESGDEAYRVTLNKLPAKGIYILRVNDGFNSDVKKFVVF